MIRARTNIKSEEMKSEKISVGGGPPLTGRVSTWLEETLLDTTLNFA